jgi:hypothetical protein
MLARVYQPVQARKNEGQGNIVGCFPKFSSSFSNFALRLGFSQLPEEQSGDYQGPDTFQKLLTPLITQTKNQFYLFWSHPRN